RRHTRLQGDWSSDVCSSDLQVVHESIVENAEVRALSSSSHLALCVDVTCAGLLLSPQQHSHLNPAGHDRWQTATNLRAPPIAELPVTKASVRERMTPGHAARHFVPHLPSGPLLRHNYGYRSDENCDLHHSTAVF